MSETPTEKPKPIDTHRDGNLKTAIWENPGQHGKMYNVTLTYSYLDKDETWRETTSIPEQQLLKAGRLMEMAYGSVQRLKDQDRERYVQQQQSQAEQGPAQEHPREP